MKIVILNNQTLLDIAIQEYGTIEAMFDFAIANNLSIHSEPQVGAEFNVAESTENTDILNYYISKSIKPTTALQTNKYIYILEGIGYMIIGTNFKIG